MPSQTDFDISCALIDGRSARTVTNGMMATAANLNFMRTIVQKKRPARRRALDANDSRDRYRLPPSRDPPTQGGFVHEADIFADRRSSGRSAPRAGSPHHDEHSALLHAGAPVPAGLRGRDAGREVQPQTG